MSKIKLKTNHYYKFTDGEFNYIGQYIGTQSGFECCVCHKGCKAHTFNVWYDKFGYETFGFGPKHLPDIIEDLGESDEVIIGE